MESWELGWPRPRVIVLSFPHNPTTTTVELADLQRLVDWARERDVVLVHDFAYADVSFDGWRPPSILQCVGAKEVAVELFSMTKSFSMAGWRVAFLAGRPDVVEALAKLKSYLDYGTFQPIQIAATVVLQEAGQYPAELKAVYESRRNAMVDGLGRIGWDVLRPRGTMFVWARIPEPYRDMSSIDFAKHLVRQCDVAVSPGEGFGPGGDEYVRFALIENEQRIGQAVRGLRKGLTRLS
jgi:alanine-synthesizing transaminase